MALSGHHLRIRRVDVVEDAGLVDVRERIEVRVRDALVVATRDASASARRGE